MDDWFAHWFDEDYELLYAHRDEAEAREAVATALKHAPELATGAVLDLGCGAGRHLTELRAVNPHAFGLDLSSHLLASAPLALQPVMVRGDMRHLPVRPRSLAGITLWFTPFGYFADAENRRLLATLAGALRPGGILLLDYLNAARLRSTLVEEEILEREGVRAYVTRTLERDRVVKRIVLERLDGGARREVVESVRLYDPEDVEHMAGDAGFRLRTVLGSYMGEVFNVGLSERWIGIFQLRP